MVTDRKLLFHQDLGGRIVPNKNKVQKKRGPNMAESGGNQNVNILNHEYNLRVL